MRELTVLICLRLRACAGGRGGVGISLLGWGNGPGTLVSVVVQAKGRKPREMIIILPRVHH